jgi:pimeloyl-ACP methyl ester carboxylesterase
LDALAIDEAHFVGWSLGGHVALEMAPDLRNPRGFVIFGTPPLTSGEAMSEAFFPNPAMKVTFQDGIESLEASAYVAAFFRPGFADIPPFFLDDVLRTDGRARSNLGARAVCIWVYAYPAFLRYAAHSAGGYWVRISPQAWEMAS